MKNCSVVRKLFRVKKGGGGGNKALKPEFKSIQIHVTNVITSPRDIKRQPQKVNYLYIAVLCVPRNTKLINPVRTSPTVFCGFGCVVRMNTNFSTNITDLCNVDAMCFTGIKNPTFKILFRSPSYYTGGLGWRSG